MVDLRKNGQDEKYSTWYVYKCMQDVKNQFYTGKMSYQLDLSDTLVKL